MSKSNKTDVAVSGYEFEGARAKAVADITRAVRDEGQDVKQVALRFIGGLIAKRIFSDLPRAAGLAKGIGIAGSVSPGRTPKAGQAVRSADVETVWDSCRRQWTRCAKDAGVLKARKPSAKAKKPKAQKQGKSKPAAKALAKPKDAASANLALLNMAQSASGYCKKHETVICAEASHAVANFLAAMAKLAK